jgi:hypothetical protein
MSSARRSASAIPAAAGSDMCGRLSGPNLGVTNHSHTCSRLRVGDARPSGQASDGGARAAAPSVASATTAARGRPVRRERCTVPPGTLDRRVRQRRHRRRRCGAAVPRGPAAANVPCVLGGTSSVLKQPWPCLPVRTNRIEYRAATVRVLVGLLQPDSTY